MNVGIGGRDADSKCLFANFEGSLSMQQCMRWMGWQSLTY